jgi:hypothetical protein
MLRHRSRPFFLPLASCVVFGALAWSASALAGPDTALSLRIDPGFSRSKLTTVEQQWYDLTWANSVGCASTVITRSLYDDLYTYGRSVGDYNAFMLMGLRATGDRAFLDRVKVVTDSMRTKLRDADDACVGGTTDGFLDWRWRAVGLGYSCTNTGGFYGSDHHQLDDAMTHGNYLLHHWEAKWIQRAGGDSLKGWMDNSVGMYKHEAHVVANIMRAAYYLWKITGNPFYKGRADALAALSATNCVPNAVVPTAYSWHHQVDNTTTWQAINYAEYTSSVFCDLHFDGYTPYASTVEMKKFMSTWRDIVFGASSPGFTLMSPDVNGGGTPIAISASGASAYARWDSTGKLSAYATALSGGTPSAVSIYTIRLTAGAEAAVSTRGSAGNAPPTRITDLAAAMVSDQSVLLTWTAPGDDGLSGRATSYELRRSSQPITDANFASATVVPISLTPQAAGSAEQFAVLGLTPGAAYYFAIRALDDLAAASPVSNNVSVTTLATDTVPPAAVKDLDPNH